MAALMDEDVTAVCGPKGRHNAGRVGVRHGHGHEHRSVSLGGRRVPVERPRMRAADGGGELPVATYELFSVTEVLGRMALERMLAGLSTRRYPVGLEPAGTRTEQTATATSRSAVSRRFVAATETALAELLAADLSGLDLVALIVDGVHLGEHTCVVALGIDIDGVKHPLSPPARSTENATLVTELIVGLRERGLDVTRPILALLDGSKALRRAVLDVFDRPVIARRQPREFIAILRFACRESEKCPELGECVCLGRRPPCSRSTFQVELNAWSNDLTVEVGGHGVVSHAGSAVLRLIADNSGLTGALSTALRRRGFTPVHDRGRVLVDTVRAHQRNPPAGRRRSTDTTCPAPG
jgi:hypothetical protein